VKIFRAPRLVYPRPYTLTRIPIFQTSRTILGAPPVSEPPLNWHVGGAPLATSVAGDRCGTEDSVTSFRRPNTDTTLRCRLHVRVASNLMTLARADQSMFEPLSPGLLKTRICKGDN